MALSIADVRNSLHQKYDEVYAKKQMHHVPEAPVVDRPAFFALRTADKVVLDIGASGTLHDLIVKAAAKVYGLDKEAREGVEAIDLDDYHAVIPTYPDVELIVVGEVLEHLSNPGWFLDRLRKAYPTTPMILSVPNAVSDITRFHLQRSQLENVNLDHVAWYSYVTLQVLLRRHGWEPQEFSWYHGKPWFAEGLIMVAT